MRTPLLLTATLILAVAFIYYAGNFTPTATPHPLTNPTVQPTTTATALDAPLTPDQARQLTSPQRLDLFKKAVSNHKLGDSAKYLCTLIEALTKEELTEATNILTATEESSGPYFPNRVALTLSIQWGRLDPFGALQIMSDPSWRYYPIPREVMKSWFETDPAAALAWAPPTPVNFGHENEMVAAALTLSAAGDPQKLVATLLELPAGDRKIEYCLEDYFDLITTTPSHPDPAAIYENIPAPLREDAWPIAMRRLIDADPQAAAAWLTAHVNDPGRNYSVVRNLIVDLTEKDPAGTAQWAATFPDDEQWEPWRHPARSATLKWHADDPTAAKTWLQTQPSTLQWVADTLKQIEARENPQEPEANETEN